MAFAAAGFTVTAERMSVINFTTSLDVQPYTFLFARPKQISRASLFIQPYTPNVNQNTKSRSQSLGFMQITFDDRLGSSLRPWS